MEKYCVRAINPMWFVVERWSYYMPTYQPELTIYGTKTVQEQEILQEDTLKKHMEMAQRMHENMPKLFGLIMQGPESYLGQQKVQSLL